MLSLSVCVSVCLRVFLTVLGCLKTAEPFLGLNHKKVMNHSIASVPIQCVNCVLFSLCSDESSSKQYPRYYKCSCIVWTCRTEFRTWISNLLCTFFVTVNVSIKPFFLPIFLLFFCRYILCICWIFSSSHTHTHTMPLMSNWIYIYIYFKQNVYEASKNMEIWQTKELKCYKGDVKIRT